MRRVRKSQPTFTLLLKSQQSWPLHTLPFVQSLGLIMGRFGPSLRAFHHWVRKQGEKESANVHTFTQISTALTPNLLKLIPMSETNMKKI